MNTTNFSNVTVSATILAGNLFSGCDATAMQAIDERASTLDFAARIESEMGHKFPGIAVDHTIQWNTEGVSPMIHVSGISDDDYQDVEDMRDAYTTVSDTVFGDWDWITGVSAA